MAYGQFCLPKIIYKSTDSKKSLKLSEREDNKVYRLSIFDIKPCFFFNSTIVFVYRHYCGIHYLYIVLRIKKSPKGSNYYLIDSIYQYTVRIFLFCYLLIRCFLHCQYTLDVILYKILL